MSPEPSPIELSVVVLAYRNGPVLKSWVTGLHQSLSALKDAWEIILVTNVRAGETDEAQAVARDLERTLSHVRAVARIKAGGYGWDVKSGLAVAGGKIVAYIDGDGQVPSDSILTAYRKLISEGLDLVKARRIRRADGRLRELLSVLFNFAFRIFFGIIDGDVNAKPKLLRREALRAMELRSDDWFIDAEIMIRAKQQQLKIGEVPISFHALRGRRSLVGMKTVWEFMKNFWIYRFKN